MTRLRSLPAAVLAAVLACALLASCGSTSAAAVTVNGVELSDDDFRQELEVLVDNPEFAQAVFGATPPEGNGSVETEFAASVLRLRVLVMLIDAEFESRDLTVTQDDLDAAEETFTPELVALIDELPQDSADAFRHWNAQLVVLREALEAEAADRPDEVSDEEVQQWFDDNQTLFTDEEVCARHILVETEAEADDVIAELDGGADFAELATERSVDPSAETNGGDLGCAGRDTYVPPFEDAAWNGPIGEVQGPVETDFGFHVIVVDSRGAPGFDTLEGEIRAYLESPESRDGQQILNLMIQSLVSSADVSVNSRYGEWDPATQTVTPPAGPSTTASTAPSAELVE